ncbi:MAG: double-strand break repair helicase AddA [Methyloceanibacter sp.]|nr:double-strand break repair helicase AddA [Methyloceanibacter sp.]
MTRPSELVQTADANQARAAEPMASVWVSANAGTGKTAVLVKRFLRLLLVGAKPESILCLTYTKAAAAEMQNRLLKTLSGWALAPEEKLREELAALLREPFREKDMQTARRLFARVLEARGGLKIYTIHGFCERLLQRFPLEANVTPNFTVLDETSAMRTRDEAFDSVAVAAAENPDRQLGSALTRVLSLTSEDQFREIVGAILAKRTELARIVHLHMAHVPATHWPAAEAEALRTFFDVAEAEEDALVAAQGSVLTDEQIDDALAALADFGKTKTDEVTENTLRHARAVSRNSRARLFKTLFLTQKGEPRSKLITKAVADCAPDIAAMLDEAKLVFARLETDLAHLRVVEATGAVLTFADAVQTAYEAVKQREAALDYDDLIVKTLALLSRSNATAWVLYKIDGGIDHILVDEAQDTNPEQWSIVEALADEFFAGVSARPQPRTLFAVGDEKQSIYSFQGANPVRFGETGRHFRAAAKAVEMPWSDVPLNVSFRSTVPVLEAVDRVFAQDDAARGLTFLDDTVIQHYAARQGQAGLVELWEVETTEPPTASAPFEPWNEDESGAEALESLCQRLAGQIRHWLDTDEILASQDRPIRAGDILILVRRREPFTAPMIRALKRAGIPVAGADRMHLLEQLAVQDLIALADVLLMPEDDLALAVVLRSPLFGLDETALFDLAYGREGSLWSTLLAKAENDDRYTEAATELRALLAQADMLPPFEFYAGLLGAQSMKMRKRMLSRLGPEAAEAIDEFMDAALAYEREDATSLQGFVAALREGNINVKRDMDQDRDEVRIMTVHGAKGLQAPIVIMPDTCSVPRNQGPQIYLSPRAGGVPGDPQHLLWPPAGHSGVPGLANAKSAVARAEQEEYRRLLYVAMTRAEDRLYVCGWQGVQRRNEGCWYDLIDRGIGPVLTPDKDAQGRVVRRMSCPQEAPPRQDQAAPARETPSPLPDWARTPAPQERLGAKLSPSRLAQNATGEGPFGAEQPPLGPKDLAEDMRFVRGRLIHSLLQHLPQVPQNERQHAAKRFVSARGDMLSVEEQAAIVSESLAIVGDPQFAPLFAPASLAEVPVVARIGEGDGAFDLEGQIDRLAILEDSLLILDYKTNRPPPTREEDVAPAYIGQLAAYRLALRSMFPGKPVRAALIWTDGPRLMEISSTLLETAESGILQARGGLDAHGGRT